MRILFVAISESIHTARWITQIADQGWDLHLFPSIDNGLFHPDLRNITVHHSFYGNPLAHHNSLKLRGIPLISKAAAYLARKAVGTYNANYRISQLQYTIKRLQPDIIHSMEIQAAGYLTMAVKNQLKNNFPPWIVTNWGSDIYLFGRLSQHEPQIREVLKHCDYYTCECQRDVCLANDYGLKGKAFPAFPNSGGFNIEEVSNLRQGGNVSERQLIMLKGYQGWAGRALVGLRALERCADLLPGYTIVIYSASPEVVIAAELFSKATNIPTRIIPKDTSHHEILRMQGHSRISLGLSISDAISTSVLEAIVMGSFPIQSWTACADEWIKDGRNGLLVPPEDPEIIEHAIRQALTEDNLVNQAAKENYHLAARRLDQAVLKPEAINIYTTVAQEQGISV